MTAAVAPARGSVSARSLPPLVHTVTVPQQPAQFKTPSHKVSQPSHGTAATATPAHEAATAASCCPPALPVHGLPSLSPLTLEPVVFDRRLTTTNIHNLAHWLMAISCHLDCCW